MASEPFFRSIQLDRVALRVADLDQARHFYEGTLGLHARPSGYGAVTLSAGADGAELFELEAAPSAPARPPGAAGLFHVALLFPTRASLGRVLTRLVKAGVRLGSADHGVSEALYLADPEGNGLELYVDRPAAAWPEAGEDGQVTMFTEALDLASLAAAGAEATRAMIPPSVRVGHMHLAVSSLDRAEAFYSQRLGFAVRQRNYPGALFLARDGYHHHLGVNTWRSRTSATAGTLGLIRFGVRVADHRELERLIAAAHDRVIGPGPHGGTLMQDFDGIEIKLLESSGVQRS
jgi:catechol 2,3-dioxygenase